MTRSQWYSVAGWATSITLGLGLQCWIMVVAWDVPWLSAALFAVVLFSQGFVRGVFWAYGKGRSDSRKAFDAACADIEKAWIAAMEKEHQAWRDGVEAMVKERVDVVQELMPDIKMEAYHFVSTLDRRN